MSRRNPISVIIRTSNSARPLRRLLRRFKMEEEDEIVVVDTGSKDATVDLAGRAGAQVIRNREPFNYSRTLNLGFAAAKNDWLLVLSVHCPPVNEDFLERYREVLTKVPEEVAVIHGLQIFSGKQYATLDKSLRLYREPGSLRLLRGGGNPNALYRRSAWEKHPFDETLVTGEDFAWSRWALEAGLVVAEAPEAAVYYRNLAGPVYRFNKACNEVWVMGPQAVPLSWGGLMMGAVSATRRLLIESFAVSTWLGQLAHLAGVFVATRRHRPLEGSVNK